MDTKTLHELEKQLDTFMEKKSIKDTTTGQEIPEPPPADEREGRDAPHAPLGLHSSQRVAFAVGHCGAEDTEGAGPLVSSAVAAFRLLTNCNKTPSVS